MRATHHTTLALLALLAVSSLAGVAGAVAEPIVLASSPPGMAPDGTLGRPYAIVLNNNDQVAVASDIIIDSDLGPRRITLIDPDGTVTVLLEEGGPAPDPSAVIESVVSRQAIGFSDIGWAFAAYDLDKDVPGTNSANDRLYSVSTKTSEAAILRKNEEVLPDSVRVDLIISPDAYDVGPHGHAIVAVTFATEAARDTGVFTRDTDGTLMLIAREGDLAPGLTTFHRDLRDAWTQMNDDGLACFSNPDLGVFAAAPGQVAHAVALRSAAAPGLPGVTMNQFGRALLDNDGRAVVYATLFGAVTPDTDAGLFAYDATTINPQGAFIARRGDPAPGTTAFYDVIQERSITVGANGFVAFTASLTGPGVTADNDTGVWAGTPGALELIVREGDPAPGTPGIFTADALNDGQEPFFFLYSNDHAELMIPAFVNGPDVYLNDFAEFANIRGIWVKRPGAAPELIVRDADPVHVELTPGAPETRYLFSISEQALPSAEAVRPDHNFNNNGRFHITTQLSPAPGVYQENGAPPPPRAILLFSSRPVNDCIADTNGDGVVDIIDFGVFGTAFGASEGDPNYNEDVDFVHDGIIDIIDFGIFGQLFGRTDCLQ